MEPVAILPEKKARKKRSDAGIPRPKAVAPIEVAYRLKGSTEWVEIGCALKFASDGFYVFIRPSPSNPYCQERREVAISEVAEMIITAANVIEDAPRAYDVRPQAQETPKPTGGPVFHNARQNAAQAMAALMQSNMPGSDGPAKLDVMPGLSFGDSAG